jgi:hypothetical protein
MSCNRGELMMLGIYFMLLFAGCFSVVNERLDPAKSSVSRHILNRPGIANDGSIVVSSGGRISTTLHRNRELITLATFQNDQFAPLVSSSKDQVVSFQFLNGNGYVNSTSLIGLTDVNRSYNLGKMIAVPVAFSPTKRHLLVYAYSSDGLGQGVVMSPSILDLFSGKLFKVGDNAIVDCTGTHLLVLKGRDLWAALLDNPTKMERVASDLNPLAIASDGRKAIVTKEDDSLQLLDISTGILTPLMTKGHSALFLRDDNAIAVVEGDENSISLVSIGNFTSRRLTEWTAFNTLPISSNNGRFFVFERFDDEFGMSRSIFVYDHDSEELGRYSIE